MIHDVGRCTWCRIKWVHCRWWNCVEVVTELNGKLLKSSVQWQWEVVQPLSKTVSHLFNKLKNAMSLWSYSSTPKHISKKNVNRCPNRGMPVTVHSHASHRRQRAKTACVSIKWTGPQNVVQLCGGIIQSHKERWPLDTCYNVADPWEHQAEWTKPDTRDHMLYDSGQIKCPE